MEKSKLIEIFSTYSKSFDFDDPIIALKYNHALAVANFSYDIAGSIGLDEEEKMLGFFIGLVHEIGSYENWKKTKTYQDTDLTIKLLFKEKLIVKFDIQKKYYKIIDYAILMQTKNEIDYEKISLYTDKLKNGSELYRNIVIYCKILQDANKLDMFGMFKRKLMPVVNATYTKSSLSKVVLKSFKTESKVQLEDIKSFLDQIVYFLSLVYDLHFDYSKKYAKQINFSQAIYEYYYNELMGAEKEKLWQVLKYYKDKSSKE